ncbi:glycoside hydrolase family 9 protein [Rosettibacter firmus]|uniref:glycoside hydrolase family 9 protein n=1 Tax=Rosettibacter firmus TaxID=3111522 RepID=UPI00336BE30E
MLEREFKIFRTIFFIIIMIGLSVNNYCQKLKLNDLEYFESRGFDVFVFNNQYNGFFFDEKTAGIEFIHHGVRTATGGAVRLRHTPEQWDLVPMLIDKKVDKENNSITVKLEYDKYNFISNVTVTGKEDGIIISVFLEKPLPAELVGHAGFNLEFLPSAYFEKTYLIDGKPGVFPLYPSGPVKVKPNTDKIPQFANHNTFDDRGRNEYVDPEPIAVGKTIILAPEDPERRIQINSLMNDIMLFDGRNVAQNGWFVVRSLIPENKTGKVVEWIIKASTINNWVRQPNIAYSQVGYHPAQKKLAIIELDKNDTFKNDATLYKLYPDGETKKIFTGNIVQWGIFLRYKYGIFDFSSITDTGLFIIEYETQKTKPFMISKHAYENIWQQTLGIWFPVQMDHMFVNEAYRVWHGVPYKDDALQAPPNHIHFDGYKMESTTDTKYKPYERIPGLAVGGWFDAGDFDIQTGSHCDVILNFVDTWEQFKLNYDQTYIDQKQRYVDIHRPDGIPDIIQQIEHGTLQLVAQQKYIGHAVRGIIVGNLHQYHHLGDASTVTDNLPYNPSLKPYETDGKSSGTMDDRWVFTNRVTWLNYYASAALAASYRALKDYNKDLAEEALTEAIKAWKKEQLEGPRKLNIWEERRGTSTELLAALELFKSTNDESYKKYFINKIWDALNDSTIAWNMSIAIKAVPYFDKEYKTKLKSYVEKYKSIMDKLLENNPFGVPLQTRGWGANSVIINQAITNYYLNKHYPEIIDPEYVFRGLNYILGCHPYSNISFVSGVGVQSKKIAYGGNRADFSFIAGGVVPGLLILKPDFPENKEDWPFLWGENEYVINICAAYIFLSNAVNNLVNSL